MLSRRVLHLLRLPSLCNHSCSTFSSVLTLRQKAEQDDSKPSQLPKNNKAVQNNSFTEHEQATQSDFTEGSLKLDAKKPQKRYKTDKWKPRNDWREQGDFDRRGKNQWEHSKPSKQKSRWDDQDSRNNSWITRDSPNLDSDENQWHRVTKPYKSPRHGPGSDERPYRPQSRWNQDENPRPQRQYQPHHPSRNGPDRSPDKPVGKRLRKKEKLGFIESEPAPARPGDRQMLYGLHPVSLALSAGLRQVNQVYHRAVSGPGDTRLSRLVAECAARGVSTVPLPPAMLDQMAGGTGVHQGVCARVTPLLPRPVDELLVRTGYPPLGTPPPPTAAAGERNQTATNFWSLETDTGGPDRGGEDVQTPAVKDKEQQPPVSTKSESEKLQETTSPDSVVSDPASQPGASSADDTVEAERPGRRRRLWLMLDRVQDPMNFGSIIRSSYFLGVDAIIIPDKNSCPLSPTVSKASAGALEVFPVYSAPAASCRQLLQLLASRQWQLVVADTETGGNNTQRAPPIVAGTDTILVVGNEGRGVEASLAALCQPWTVPAQRDLVHGVESLNVGVATGILLSQLVLAR
ncbi:uncharacterized protein LOC122374933 isoform X1 [Amphibalanus amphitrite]|nr:uncharacterized protein LOC122374933 isoform X1 [Amphibalanus amphitrite]XP_043209936.1 uncharacterized protein LOC122374933 isoform X1 [Amphibalanus amphitrite]XP_043209937.1 uncharacterized protein LOC122374933 isoform X1 [Amphibalanus amphitrite]XP_043209938.1 uncharacterized protein LOC122374933 isoform X1 [Amphibalanus amphitrite]XP_043209939.1 uncharacterized protein LOC122374933 isoform X1 [Amphibalanus amphitrite]